MYQHRTLVLLVAAVLLVGFVPRPEARAAAHAPQAPAVPRQALASFAAPALPQPAQARPAADWNIHLPLAISAGAPPAAQAPELLRVAFYHVQDSDGYRPKDDAEIVLAFEPSGVAQLYVAQPDDAIAFRGSYTYAQGRLALTFSDDEFHPAVQFALDLARPTVTMPFNVFTPDTPGPSTWRREIVSVEHNLWLIFTCATINEQLPIDQAIGRATAYASALIGRPAPARAGEPGLQAAPPTLVGAEALPDGIRLRYQQADGTVVPVDVVLFSWAGGATPAPLKTSSLANDPRVHLNQNDGLNPAGDPTNKRAVLIAPFYSKRMLSWNPFNPAIALENEQAVINFGTLQQTFEREGYSVVQLTDENASVANLIRELSASPGFVLFSSHGDSDGTLATGTFLGTQWSLDSAFAAFAAEKERLKTAGYGDLLAYKYGNQEPLLVAAVRNGMTSKYQSGFVGITPAFWRWLRERGANFDTSLVYISACSTAATPDLRDAIRARSYFSYDTTVSIGTSAAVGKYLVESLARNTRSAEEVYYNILRVVRTGQMIYKEDKLLDGYTAWGDGKTSLADHLQAYVTMGPNSNSGPDGIMSYVQSGWLGAAQAGTVQAGDVWYLLFVARWSQNAQTGANNLIDCWNEYWSHGQQPGLGSDCRNAAPGSVPSQDEVAYAIYLLRGESPLAFGGTSVPRWSMSDATP